VLLLCLCCWAGAGLPDGHFLISSALLVLIAHASTKGMCALEFFFLV
jgi:hypothetical protein